MNLESWVGHNWEGLSLPTVGMRALLRQISNLFCIPFWSCWPCTGPRWNALRFSEGDKFIFSHSFHWQVGRKCNCLQYVVCLPTVSWWQNLFCIVSAMCYYWNLHNNGIYFPNVSVSLMDYCLPCSDTWVRERQRRVRGASPYFYRGLNPAVPCLWDLVKGSLSNYWKD